MKKLLLCSVCLCLCLVMLCGCFLKHIEDTNGADDFSIASFTEEDKLSSSTWKIYFGSIYSLSTNGQSGQLKFKATKISGIWDSDVLQYGVNYATVTVTCTSGNADVFFMSEDNQRLATAQINGTTRITVRQSCVVRVVAESANVTVEISW